MLLSSTFNNAFARARRISATDVLMAVNNAQKQVNAEISALGFETRLEAALVQAEYIGKKPGMIIGILDMLAQARSSIPVIRSGQGAVVKDYVTVRKSHRVRALSKEYTSTRSP